MEAIKKFVDYLEPGFTDSETDLGERSGNKENDSEDDKNRYIPKAIGIGSNAPELYEPEARKIPEDKSKEKTITEIHHTFAEELLKPLSKELNKMKKDILIDRDDVLLNMATSIVATGLLIAGIIINNLPITMAGATIILIQSMHIISMKYHDKM